MDEGPLWWPVRQLIDAYRSGALSPVEVCEQASERIAHLNPLLHAVVLTTGELARSQAVAAETAYRSGTAGPLAGVPVSIKDAFHIEGHVTTLGSLAHADDVRPHDSGAARRLRQAGALFVGKTNVPEFCQSATTDNLLGPDTANPFDPRRTAGGSSGGAASSVAAAMCTLGLGSDGGGSIRIPASFCGLVGFKPTYGTVPDEGGFRAFSPFISAGPLARCVADARLMHAVLTDGGSGAGDDSGDVAPCRIAWCAKPEGRPIDDGVGVVAGAAVGVLASCGHDVHPVDLDLAGWEEIFGPLVLADEGQRRGHLLGGPHELTWYCRRSLEAAERLDPAVVAAARTALEAYRERVDRWFGAYDVIATPATATTAFELGCRPSAIAGEPVSKLWGAFPFAVPFNVSGHPAVVLPAGFVEGLPAAIQLVGRRGSDHELLAVAEQLEAALDVRPFARLASFAEGNAANAR
ncbi:amidase [Candidatus Poriferisodalis sp.]|uniref:amidase n=1 Tax=Candidatus Poriferisodalis sp. TaxID=3101277 RepID=UPI003B019831